MQTFFHIIILKDVIAKYEMELDFILILNKKIIVINRLK